MRERHIPIFMPTLLSEESVQVNSIELTPRVHKAHFTNLKTSALWLVNMRAPPNDKNPKQSWLFLIGWIFGLANHKALVFEVRVVGFVSVKGIDFVCNATLNKICCPYRTHEVYLKWHMLSSDGNSLDIKQMLAKNGAKPSDL